MSARILAAYDLEGAVRAACVLLLEAREVVLPLLRQRVVHERVRDVRGHHFRRGLVMDADRLDGGAGERLTRDQHGLADARAARQRTSPADIAADELVHEPELGTLPRQADADVRGMRIEDGALVT